MKNHTKEEKKFIDNKPNFSNNQAFLDGLLFVIWALLASIMLLTLAAL